MTKPRFTEQQIAQALGQTEQGTPAGTVCRKLGVREAAFYAWQRCYAAMGVADLTWDKQMLQEVLQKKV